MAGLDRFKALLVVTALVVLNASALVPVARAVPLSEGAPASSETVAQSGNCPAGRQPDGHCLPGGPESPPPSPGGPIQPPVTPPVPPPTIPPGTPPAMPPGTFPIMPPSGRPQATRPQDSEFPLYVIGSAKATFHIHDDDHDILYTSDEVPLTFLKRAVQDMEGNTQYILAPVQTINLAPGGTRELRVIWRVEGKEFDCTVKGKAIVTLPAAPGGETYLDPTAHTTMSPTGNLIGNITEPAYGYLNVVGQDGGDFHSVVIKAFNPDARLIKTCPGDPPVVTEENFQAGFLLHILSQPNTRENAHVIFQGHQEYDQCNRDDFLNLLPPGPNQDIAREYLRQAQTSSTGTSCRYTWTWKLVAVPQVAR